MTRYVRHQRPGMFLWTDGSCYPNPGPGGWAVVMSSWADAARHENAAWGHEARSTNQRMELRAMIAALEYANGTPCAVFTDSMYTLNVTTKWPKNWESKGWKTKAGHEPVNLDLIQPLWKLWKESQAEVNWVKGHNGNRGNHLADELAHRARLKEI